MQILEREFFITDNMCGPNQYIKPSGVLDILQSIAGVHADEMNIGYDVIKKQNLGYIIARNKYDLKKPIKRFSLIKVVTWPGEAKKVDLDRYYEFYDVATNELLLTGVSKWVLIDTTTRKIMRTSCIDYPKDVYEKVLYDTFEKLKFDDIEFKNKYDFVVRYSDLDLNSHMNNTKYADIFNYDLDKVVKHFEINYLYEVVMNDCIEVYYHKEDNLVKYQGINKDKVSFNAMIEYF